MTFSRRNPLSGHKRATLLLCILLSLPAGTFAASDARTALEKAVVLIQQGELDGAERQARIALSDPTTSAAANSILGTIRFQQKRFPESIRFLEEAIRREPRLIGARLNLAAVYEAENKPDQALPLYRKVLALDSSDKMARVALVELEAQAGHYKESLEYAQPMLAELR
ncbi:MAG TPA: tetratricopeptide repeat protein, partial [Terriglobales bacterium]|nr:tetratricopeptide repeat protein [Terriglobales bacterium]